MEEKITTKKSKPKKKPLLEIYDQAESIITMLVAVVMVVTFVTLPTIVNGASMQPTLHDGQILAMARIYCIDYNDIVVIHVGDNTAFDENDRRIIKRVIGLPGDTIGIDTEAGVVIRNGEALPLEETDGVIYENGHTIKDYTRVKGYLPEGAELEVPENCIFVLGDNRNDSRDSRNRTVGMVNQNYVIGKVLFRVTPFELFGKVV
jgi:signal peptidase I